jgi:hypothetical protein
MHGCGSGDSNSKPSVAKPPSGGGLTVRMPSLDAYTSREIIMVSPTADDSPSHGSNEQAWIAAALEMGAAPGGMTGLPAIGEIVSAAGGGGERVSPSPSRKPNPISNPNPNSHRMMRPKSAAMLTLALP